MSMPYWSHPSLRSGWLIAGLMMLLGANPSLVASDAGPVVPTPPAAAAAPSAPATHVWPLVALEDGWELKLFQPHPVSLAGERLAARAAFSLTTHGAGGGAGAAQPVPVFGVVTFSSAAEIDRESRRITLHDRQVTDVLLPASTNEDRDRVTHLVLSCLSGTSGVLSLDRVLAGLQRTGQAQAATASLNTAPPRIIVAQTPSVLLLLDGDPAFEPLASGWERVINTPFMLAHDQKGGSFWLFYAGRWYTAPALAASWRAPDAVPAAVSALESALLGAQGVSDAPPGPVLAIIASTEPAELIATDGPPTYEPIAGTSLIGISNTDRDCIIDPASQRVYALLSGRWYAATSLSQGPWSYVAPDALPGEFASIPADSRYAEVRAEIKGTTEADEAVQDAHLPQTAAVRRDASITVAYDGDPQWTPIEGTALAYAGNSQQEVIEESPTQYDCCEQGVWYAASTPFGPWLVATVQPAGLDAIPPACPCYHLRYACVFELVNDVVWVGYYPGYFGCFVQGGCVVWGTGYRYYCWHQHHYYPRPWTWGCGMLYNPWTCRWGSDCHAPFAGSSGWLAFGVRGAGGPWWGPRGYRPDFLHHDRTAAAEFERARLAPDARERASREGHDDIYHQPRNQGRVVVAQAEHPVPSGTRDGGRQAEPPAPAYEPARAEPQPQGSRERVISGEHGEVYRSSDDTWQRWDVHQGWHQLDTTAGRPPAGQRPIDTPPPAAIPSPTPEEPGHRQQPILRSDEGQSLERERHVQERGEQREEQFHSHQSAPPIRVPARSQGGHERSTRDR